MVFESHAETSNLLQNVSDLIFFKTEVKKKAGIPEDVIGIAQEENARKLASKFLAHIASELIANAPNTMGKLFSQIPSIMTSVCEVNYIIIFDPLSLSC